MPTQAVRMPIRASVAEAPFLALLTDRPVRLELPCLDVDADRLLVTSSRNAIIESVSTGLFIQAFTIISDAIHRATPIVLPHAFQP
jgi:hypothetical protein